MGTRFACSNGAGGEGGGALDLSKNHSRESPRSAWLEVLRNIDDNIDEKDFRAALDIHLLGVEAPA